MGDVHAELPRSRLAPAAPFLPARGETEKGQAGAGGGQEPAQAGHELDDPATEVRIKSGFGGFPSHGGTPSHHPF